METNKQFAEKFIFTYLLCKLETGNKEISLKEYVDWLNKTYNK